MCEGERKKSEKTNEKENSKQKECPRATIVVLNWWVAPFDAKSVSGLFFVFYFPNIQQYLASINQFEKENTKYNIQKACMAA